MPDKVNLIRAVLLIFYVLIWAVEIARAFCRINDGIEVGAGRSEEVGIERRLDRNVLFTNNFMFHITAKAFPKVVACAQLDF